MAFLERSKLFASPKMDTRIKSANVQNSERWLGYFFSPLLIYMAYFTMSGTYLNQFYIDVVKLGGIAGGAFIVLLPVISKLIDAITNLAMGAIIDHTKTRQGKARPWILISGPVLAISGILLYSIPRASTMVQAIWVAVSYNLYFAFALTIYNMSQMMLVPLSTRNTKQRDGLALFLSMGQTMLPGAVIYMIVPLFLLPWMGVDQSRWALIMSIISIAILPGTIIQYFFTKERVSEDAAGAEVRQVSLLTQIKTCFADRFWVMYVVMWMLYQFQQTLYSVAVNFYANWVLGTYNDGTTLTLINAIGQAPLGLGVFLLWPIAKKFGKRRTMLVGSAVACLSSLTMNFYAGDMGAVLPLLAIKAFGLLPTYLFAAMMAETMDHIEWTNGYRCDGFTATMNSVSLTVMSGLTTSIFNSGLTRTGYIPPLADGSWVAQNGDTKSWIIACVCTIPAVCFCVISVLNLFYKVEDQVPQMTADIEARHRAEAEAQGLVYVSPEEKAAAEQAENDRIAEENRIADLKARCEKKGLNFEEEEARYQAKLAEQKAKAEAKAARKNRK